MKTFAWAGLSEVDLPKDAGLSHSCYAQSIFATFS